MGSDAKSSSRLCFTFVRVTTPTAPRTPLPTKFAVAEKHTARLLVADDHDRRGMQKRRMKVVRYDIFAALGSRDITRSASITLERQLLRRGEVVLFAAYLAVILGCHLKEFEAAIGSKKTALVAQSLHLGGGEWFKVDRDLQVLIEDLHRVDASDRSCDRKAHR